MHTGNLREVGGSVMLAVPPVLLEQMHLQAGAPVGLAVNRGCLVVTPCPQKRYTLDELLAKCDAAADAPQEDLEWLEAPAIGAEML